MKRELVLSTGPRMSPPGKHDVGVILVLMFGMALALVSGCSKDNSVVEPPKVLASVAVTPPASTTALGSTVQLTALAKDSSGATLSGYTASWTVDDPAVASINANGTLTPVGVGPVMVTATISGKVAHATIQVTAAGGAPFGKVFLLVLENRDYGHVIGNAQMPYVNGLAQQYGSATEYYGVAHPSIGNYFMMTVGDTISTDDNYAGTVTADNIVRRLLAAGKTWKSYAEDIPSVGFLGREQGQYARRHNPAAYFSDVVNSPAQLQNMVPFTQFSADLAGDHLPTLSWIVPNLCNDGHDCGSNVVDAWIQTNIQPLIQSATFQRDGILIITWDESETGSQNGGGHIPWIVVGRRVKSGYQSAATYLQQSTLRFTLKALGLTPYPGLAASAPDMGEFLKP